MFYCTFVQRKWLRKCFIECSCSCVVAAGRDDLRRLLLALRVQQCGAEGVAQAACSSGREGGKEGRRWGDLVHDSSPVHIKNARTHALLLRPSGGTHSNLKFLFLPSSIIPLCPSQYRPRSLLFASSQFSSRKSSLIDNWRNHRREWVGK